MLCVSIISYLPHRLDIFLLAQAQRYPLEDQIQLVHERALLITEGAREELHARSAAFLRRRSNSGCYDVSEISETLRSFLEWYCLPVDLGYTHHFGILTNSEEL